MLSFVESRENQSSSAAGEDRGNLHTPESEPGMVRNTSTTLKESSKAPSCKCSCQSYFTVEIQSLRRDLEELKQHFKSPASNRSTETKEALSTQVERLRKENSELITTIQVLSSQLLSNSQSIHENLVSVSSDQFCPKKRSLGKNTRVNSAQPSPTIYEVIDDPGDEVCDENETNKKKKKKKKKKNQPLKKTSLTRNETLGSSKSLQPPDENSQPSIEPTGDIFIIGDSMIKDIQGYQMKAKVGSRVFIRIYTFSGAKVTDLEDHIKPSLREKPKIMIIHAGTNDVRAESPKRVAESLVDIAQMAERELDEDSTFAILGLIRRSDYPELNKKIMEVNKELSLFCRRRGWTFISNENIKDEHLNRSGLHLNRSGTSKLVSNYLTYLR